MGRTRPKIASLDEKIERPGRIIRGLHRTAFGARSEKMDPDQLAPTLEDLEQEPAAVEVRTATPAKTAASTAKRLANRGSPSARLERVAQLIHVDDRRCPRGSGALHEIGEDTGERLDVNPATLHVLVVRRPKYGHRVCEER